MSEPPRLPASADLPASPRPRQWSAVVAWVLVGLIVAWIFLASGRRARPVAAAGESANLEVSARIAVGFHQLESQVDSRNGGATKQPFESEMLNPGAAPADRVRAAIVLAHLNDSEAGRTLLLDTLLRQDLPAPQDGDVRLLQTIWHQGPEALGPDQRTRLLEQYGWFGRLALAQGLPADHPDRRAAVAPAIRAMVTVLGFMLLGLVAIISGLVLAILAIIWRIDGKLPSRHVAPSTATAPFVEAFAVYLVLMLAMSMFIRYAGLEAFGAYFLLSLATAGALVWLGWRLGRASQMWHAIGWHRGRGVFREAGAGVVGYLAGLPLLIVGFAISMILAKFTGQRASHPIENQPVDTIFQILQLYLLAAVFAPVTEETLFRGILYHHLRGRFAWVAAALFSAFIFAAIHPQGWIGVAPIAAIGFTLAMIREWRGSLIGSMTAHALNNGVLVSVMVLLRH